MKKKILTIGFSLNDEIASSGFNSNTSLMDWDIILFRPDITEYIRDRETTTFQGKPCLSDDDSFKIKAQSEHWHREIEAAIEHGKLVIIFMSECTELSIATGKKEFSGTGRNQKSTRIVTGYDNYRSLPLKINLINSQGIEIKLSAKNSEFISSYWEEFSGLSSYKVLIEGEGIPCLLTKHGDKAVGIIKYHQNSSGALLCLPDIDFYSPEFFDEEDEWTSEANEFAYKFIREIVSVDKLIHTTGERTPEPNWVKDRKYELTQERKINEKLSMIECKLQALQVGKEAAIKKVKELGRLRNLLFEKGKPLEYAILDALKIIGFSVTQFDDGESEFDVVFESKEGRLIGEAEGKDNKAINIDKLRQIALNIYEDLKREDVITPAKSVLFGNPYRLQPIDKRGDPFTTKCVSSAKASSTALVFTPDLFEVAKYLKERKDTKL